MNRKTDKARLLAALRYEGGRGITTLDFEPPHVWDEGDPIKQIARRIYDLRQEGHDIVTDGKRQGVAVYKLRQPKLETERVTPEQIESLNALLSLPVKEGPRLAIFDDEDAA
jgi:hypothetical protein